MELESISTIMATLQNIAEKTFNNNIFLFIVSHRNPQQTDISSKDYEKLLGRFHSKEYSMEDITTYHILSNAIRKNNEGKWKDLQEEIFKKFPEIGKLIWRIVRDDSKSRNFLKDLLPIHPYSAYIATSISRYVGSAERSIFSFLYDDERGFKKFIREYPKESSNGEEYFLTPDMLWDFFLPEFERSSSEKTSSILLRFRQYESELKKIGEPYIAVFKGTLLLNILYHLLNVTKEDSSLYSPSEENISNMFLGTSFQESIPEILEYMDKKGYIQRNPDGLFLVTYSTLSEKEVEEEKKKILAEYKDIAKALDKEQKDKLIRDLTSGILRENKTQIYSAGIMDYELKRRLRSDFENSYYIPIALFIAKNQDEIKEIRRIIEKTYTDEDINLDNIVFVVSNTPLTEENYKRFVDYLARSRVANKHQYNNEAEEYRNYSEKIIEQWIDRIVNGYFDVYFRQEPKLLLGNGLNSYLNEEVSRKIFWSGLENIEDLTNNNVWKRLNSEKVLEIFISAQDREDLEERTKNAPYKDLRAILMDNNGKPIVDKKLNFIEDINTNHPSYNICKNIQETIRRYQGKNFNLGDELRFLQEPPYGIYPNMANYAILAFAMRPFVNKLYEEGTGRRIDKDLLREKLATVFKYWENGKDRDKLNLRIGTKEERDLTELLIELFSLEKDINLNKARWGIRDWIKKAGYPLWSLKIYCDEETKNAIEALCFLSRNADRELKEENIKKYFYFLSLKITELKKLISPQKLEEGFKEWVKEKLNGEITEEEFYELIDFLNKNMQEEVGLWEEGKVEQNLREWEKTIIKKGAEREFIRLINRIFNLEEVNSIEDLKRGIRKSLNDLGFPLWTLKYIFSAEDIIRALNDIENLIKDIPINSETISSFLSDIRPYEPIISSNLSPKMTEQGLKTFLKRKSPTDLDLDSFILYLRDNIKKEPYTWEENDIEIALREYNFSKNMGEIFDIYYALPIEELKIRIKRKIENLPYPFWSLEFTQEGKSIFSIINEFTNSPYIHPIEDLEFMLDNILKEGVKELLRENKLKELSITWLENWLREQFGLKTSIEEYKLDEIIQKLKRKVPPEDFHWNRSTVENQLYKDKDIENEIFKNIQEKIKQKIISSTDKDFKGILLRIINEYPEVCIKLEEYL